MSAQHAPGPWHAVKLACYVAPRLAQWFVCRGLPNGHVEHLRHDSGRIGEDGSIRHFNNEAEAHAAIAKATGSAALKGASPSEGDAVAPAGGIGGE